LLLILFPTGRLTSRRFRPVLWIGATGVAVATIATALNPIRFEINAAVALDNPFGLRGLGGLLSLLIGLSAAMIFPVAALSVGALVLRYRGGSGHEREQIKWLAYVAITDAAILIIGLASTAVCASCDQGSAGDAMFAVFFLIFALGIPAAVGAAVLRHGLYDIDIIINKTVLYGLLARLLHPGLGGDRGGDRHRGGQPVERVPDDARRRDGSAGLPAGPATGSAPGQPAGLRETGDPVRGALRVLGAYGGHGRR
jgi:hypothetical protein